MLSEGKKTLGYEQEYSGSAGNVVRNVLLRKADAGAVFVSELEKEPPEVRKQLRAVLVTPEIAPHPISAHPRVPLSVQEAVQRSVLALNSEKGGQQLLTALKLASPVPADYARDYRALEEVDVKGLANWGE